MQLNQVVFNAVSSAVASAAYSFPGSLFTAQAWLDDTGGTATVVIEVTNDPRAGGSDPATAVWLNFATLTLSGADATDGFAENATWTWMRFRITAIDTAVVSSAFGI
jgi:hypothetical protein